MNVPRVSVVVPCRNEAPVIEENLARIAAFFRAARTSFEILAVDDASDDATPQILDAAALRMPELRVLRHEENKGKGAAARAGFLEARGELVLLTDADLSAPIEMYEPFEARLTEGFDAVIGSRPHKESNITLAQPWLRRKMGETFNLLLRAMFAIPWRDTQCGFKLFRRAAFRPLFESLRTAGFAFDVEVLVAARRAGLRVLEHPVTWRNDPRSSVRLVRDSWRMLRDVALIRARLPR